MSEEKTKLRKPDVKLTNSVKVEGYLKAKSIEEGKDKNNKPFIKGTLTVLIKGKQTTDVDFYFGKFTQDNEVSKLYTEAQKLKNYVSIVDLVEGTVKDEQGNAIKVKDEEEAKTLCDVVSVSANINPNEYYDDENKLQSRPKINGKFFHRVEKKNIDVEKFGVFFDVELYFLSIKREVKDSDETGRAIIEAVVPTSIEPAKVGVMTFYVTEKDGAGDYIYENYEKNRTGNVWGELTVVVKTEKKAKGFGADNKASSDTFEYQWIITGGDKNQYDEDSKKSFDKGAVKKALEDRLVDLEKAKNEKKSKKSNGFGSSTNSAKTNLSKQTQEDITKKFDEEDY